MSVDSIDLSTGKEDKASGSDKFMEVHTTHACPHSKNGGIELGIRVEII